MCRDMTLTLQVLEQFPEIGSVDLVKHQAKEWNKLTYEEKKRYIDEAAADVQRYKQASTC